MAVRTDAEAANFSAQTTQDEIRVHEWIGDGRPVLFSHPNDLTSVSTTELCIPVGFYTGFRNCGCRINGPGVDAVEKHGQWAANLEVAPLCNTLPPDANLYTGRNFEDFPPIVDAIQPAAAHECPVPENRKRSRGVITLPAVSGEVARQKYRGGWKALGPYLRINGQLN